MSTPSSIPSTITRKNAIGGTVGSYVTATRRPTSNNSYDVLQREALIDNNNSSCPTCTSRMTHNDEMRSSSHPRVSTVSNGEKEGRPSMMTDVCAATATTAYRRVRFVHFAQILLLAFTFFTCCTMVYCISQVNFKYSAQECLLYAQWQVTPQVVDGYVLWSLDHGRTSWGEAQHCDWTQYGFVGAAIIAFLMCWFFVLFRPYKDAFVDRRSTSATRLVLPSVALSFLLFVFSLVATIVLVNGIDDWCAHLQEQFRAHKGEVEGAAQMTCSDARLVHTQPPDEGEEEDNHNVTTFNHNRVGSDTDYFTYALCAKFFAGICVITWLLNLLLITVRFLCHLDFPSYYFVFTGSATSASAPFKEELQEGEEEDDRPCDVTPVDEVTTNDDGAHSRLPKLLGTHRQGSDQAVLTEHEELDTNEGEEEDKDTHAVTPRQVTFMDIATNNIVAHVR